MTTHLRIVDQNPKKGLDCQAVVELLPWLLNGSLDRREQASVAAHLAVCESCRSELEETAQVWQMAGEHVPSLALAEYAEDQQPSEWDRGQIERHLALCPSCRQELEWATAGRVVDFERAARSAASAAGRRPARWRRLAVAASFVAALVSGVWVWNLAGPGSPAPSTGVTARVQATTPAEDWPLSAGLPVRAGERSGEENRSGNLFTDGFEAGSTSAWSSIYQ